MLSHPHKCIFVHIPKTGGTSVEQIIWPSVQDRTESEFWMGFIDEYRNKYQTGGLQHLLADQIRQEIGRARFDEYFKFTVVRNPWSKAVSQYVYMHDRADLMSFVGMNDGDEFKTYLSLIRKKQHVQWLPQFRFFMDENGSEIVDFVGRFESFDDTVYEVLEKLSIQERVIPHVNKGIKEELGSYYDNEALEIVGEMYKLDIDLLGYEVPF